MNHSHDHEQAKADKDQTDTGLTCPVMKGIPVDKDKAEKAGLVREYKGKKYYFCCDACLVEFDQNPAEFAK